MLNISPPSLRASSALEYAPMRTRLSNHPAKRHERRLLIGWGQRQRNKMQTAPAAVAVAASCKKGSSVWVCCLSQVSENNTAHATAFTCPGLDVLFLIILLRDGFSPEGHWKRDAVMVLSVIAALFPCCSLENDGSGRGFSRCVISYFRLYPKGPDCSFNRIFYHFSTRSSLLSVACLRKAHHHSEGRDAFSDASYSSWNFLSRLTCCCTMTSTEIMRLQREAKWNLKFSPYFRKSKRSRANPVFLKL